MITSKSISKNGGRAGYRGLLEVNKNAGGSKSKVVCDALILDEESRSDTYPYIKIDADDVDIGHEATVSKIGEEQLFYLMSRGLTEAEASAMIVSGFVEPITKELPLEYAVEMNRLIQLQMEGLGRLSSIDAARRASGIPSTDWERSRQFYVETLGLRPDEHAKARVLGRRHVLRHLDAGAVGRGVQAAAEAIALLHVDDVEAARAELEAKGVEFVGETVDTSVCHMATFLDPDGNPLVLHKRYAPYA